MSTSEQREQISQRLLQVTEPEWKSILKKCYTHVGFRLGKKLKWGAHSEQRLGMPAHDFYTTNAISGLFSFKWYWKFEKFTLEKQLIRIIDSMISTEVEKYKIEQRKNRQTYLIEPGQLGLFIDHVEPAKPPEIEELSKYELALEKVCSENPIYQQFIDLKRTDHSYEEISQELKINKNEAYRLRETIARKATQLLHIL